MEIITTKTKISALIKADSKSIDAIGSLAKPLEKLKNPILRKIMASRVSIAEAAKIGGIAIAEFKRVLEPLGFTFQEGPHNRKEDIAEQKPEWLQNAVKSDIDFYDVRSIIDNGADPLKEILGRFKTIESGKILCVINEFVPTPLIHLLKQERAEATFVEKIREKEFNTYFLKKDKEGAKHSVNSQEKLMWDNTQKFDLICSQFIPEKIKEVDVRELEMPEPMHLILQELKILAAGHALFINHKRVPVYLLEELAEQNIEVHINNKEEGNVKMLIFRK